MRTMILLGVMAMALTLCGCEPVLSLHPLFDDKARVFEPRLLGTWADGKRKWGKGDECTYTFHSAQENAYEIVGNGCDLGNLRGQLARLGEFLYLDVAPEKDTLLIPAHLFFKVELEGDELRLSYLDDDWLTKMLKENRITIGHEFMDPEEEGLLLTASTTELQELMEKYATDPQTAEEMKFHRQK